MNRKPVSVISGPVRLSGRRCQAISPHAMNDPPTERLTTATAVIGSALRNRKTNAANAAATPSGQSTIGSRSRLSAFLMLIRPPLTATPRWLEGEPTPVEIRCLETALLMLGVRIPVPRPGGSLDVAPAPAVGRSSGPPPKEQPDDSRSPQTVPVSRANRRHPR